MGANGQQRHAAPYGKGLTETLLAAAPVSFTPIAYP